MFGLNKVTVERGDIFAIISCSYTPIFLVQISLEDARNFFG